MRYSSRFYLQVKYKIVVGSTNSVKCLLPALALKVMFGWCPKPTLPIFFVIIPTFFGRVWLVVKF
jgi:hypothetical protein